MGWKEQYRQASWRGVKFLVAGHGFSGGRRTVTHQYPFKEFPYTEDMGRKARRFSVDMYLFGDDYFLRRDTLIAALERSGNGTLIHPYLGRKQVNCEDFNVQEQEGEGGFVRIQCQFVEAGFPAFPSAGLDLLLALATESDGLISQANAAMLEAFSVAEMPQHAINSAAATVGQVADVIEGASAGLATIAGAQAITNLANAIRDLRGDTLRLVNTPARLVDDVSRAVRNLADAILRPGDKVTASLRVSGFSTVLPAATTATRERERANQIALTQHLQTVGVAVAARNFGRVLFPAAGGDSNTPGVRLQISAQEANALTGRITAILDYLMGQATTEAVFSSLQSLRTVVIQLITSPDLSLPNLIQFTPQISANSLVLAYRFHKDIGRERELIDRNKIKHPGFIVGGQPIEVIGG